MTQFCCAYVLSRVRLCVTPWTVVHQALLSMGLLRQEYWSGLPFPTPGDLPNQRWNPYLLWLPHCRQILYSLNHQGSPKNEALAAMEDRAYEWQIGKRDINL